MTDCYHCDRESLRYHAKITSEKWCLTEMCSPVGGFGEEDTMKELGNIASNKRGGERNGAKRAREACRKSHKIN